MAKPLGRARRRIISGIAVLIPLYITVVVLRALFGFTAGIMLPLLDPTLEHWPPLARNALSVGILVLVVFGLGELVANVVGRRILALMEALLLRLPVIRVIYQASRKVVSAFEGPEASAFRSVVLVEFPRPGMQAIGFVTSTFTKDDGSTWQTVFLPTTPNPTTGFLQVIPATATVPTGFTVEEAFRMVMSLGVLSPERLAKTP
jgi:uncharacterized membrane protein